MQPLEQLAFELQRLGRQPGQQGSSNAPGGSARREAGVLNVGHPYPGPAALAELPSRPPPQQLVGSQPQVHEKVMALCTLGARPDNCTAEAGSESAAAGAPPSSRLVRLVGIPQHCTYVQLSALLTRGLAAPPRQEEGGGGSSTPHVRVCYCLPSSPMVVVDVRDDQDVQAMWEESTQHSGGERLHIYWEWEGAAPLLRYLAQQQPQPQAQVQAQVQVQQEEGGEAGALFGGQLPTSTASTAGCSSATAATIMAGAPSSTSSSLPSLPFVLPASPPHDQFPLSDNSQAPGLVLIPPSHLLLHLLISSPTSLYGQVYEGEWRGCRVAVKCLSWLLAGCPYGDAASQQAFLASAAPLASLKHRNLVEVYGVVHSSGGGDPAGLAPVPPCATGNGQLATLLHQQRRAAALGSTGVRAPAVVTEWVGGRSLRAALTRRDHPLLRSSTARLQLVADVAQGMAFLHSRGMVHFYLTPGSILLGDGAGAKVTGFELPAAKLSAVLNPQVGFSPDVLPWLAPEMAKGTAPITEKVDVFAFGIILWELWAQRPPYDTVRFAVLADSMRGSGLVMRPIIPGKGTPQPVLGWRRLMERCWAEEPQARPSFQEIVGEVKALRDAYYEQHRQAALAPA